MDKTIRILVQFGIPIKIVVIYPNPDRLNDMTFYKYSVYSFNLLRNIQKDPKLALLHFKSKDAFIATIAKNVLKGYTIKMEGYLGH